jgi:hypothetical protein
MKTQDIPGFLEHSEYKKIEDLFYWQKDLPEDVASVVESYEQKYLNGDMDYADTKQYLQDLHHLGYTFEYGLDNEPFNLQKINIKG